MREGDSQYRSKRPNRISALFAANTALRKQLTAAEDFRAVFGDMLRSLAQKMRAMVRQNLATNNSKEKEILVGWARNSVARLSEPDWTGTRW